MAAVSLNTFILIATYALMQGLLDQAVQNATQLSTGEAQLHAPGYLEDRSIYKTLKNPEAILQKLKDRSFGAVPRTYGYGLVSCRTKSAGAMFWGVDPDKERAVLRLAEHMGEGVYLSSKAHRGLVLGRKLARSLNAHVGSEIVVLVQAADGSLGNDLFTVSGILKAAGEGVDRSAAIMHIDDFRDLFVMRSGVHEIVVNTGGRVPLAALKESLIQAVPGAEVKTWRELLPTLSDMLQISDVSMSVFGAIFYLAAGLGVLNTMLMATYERIHEFGLLKALGTSPWRIVRDVTMEAWLLAFLSTVVGVVAGVAVSWVLQDVGLDTTGFAGEYTVSGIAFDPVWRASLTFRAVLEPVLVIWVVCILAALYPASISARLDPVKSLYHV